MPGKRFPRGYAKSSCPLLLQKVQAYDFPSKWCGCRRIVIGHRSSSYSPLHVLACLATPVWSGALFLLPRQIQAYGLSSIIKNIISFRVHIKTSNYLSRPNPNHRLWSRINIQILRRNTGHASSCLLCMHPLPLYSIREADPSSAQSASSLLPFLLGFLVQDEFQFFTAAASPFPLELKKKKYIYI